MPDTTEAGFTCPECGRSFTLERGLTRHRNYAHGGNAMPAAPAPPLTSLPSSVEGLAAGLQVEVTRLEAELAELDAQRSQLQAQLRPLRGALVALTREWKAPGKKANGSAPAKKKGSSRHASEELVGQVYDWLEAHSSELAEGFTGKDLHRRITANGGLTVSPDRVRLVLAQLHADGRVRLDRKTQGGGKLYKLTAARGGEGTGQAQT